MVDNNWDDPVDSPIGNINPNAYDVPPTQGTYGYTDVKVGEFTVRDSGKRQEFTTGSVRDLPDGKGRFDLISPIALRRLAQHFESGAKKYGDRNWEKGQPLSRYIDSALRHINNYMEGDRAEDHLIAAVWNLMAFVHTQELVLNGELPNELNNLK